MIRLFAGFDPREAIGFHTFVQSVIENTKSEIEIIPLRGEQADGTNSFTYERFRIPERCGSGPAIFMDGCDQIVLGDIKSLWEMYDPKKAVQVVKHEYKTQHSRKYIGTELEAENQDYPRKNWSSVMIWNCGHRENFHHRKLLNGFDGSILHRFAWLDDELIGELPIEWNWLADEYGPNEQAKLLHWTAGIPGFTHYAAAPHASEWKHYARKVNRGMA